MDSEYKRIDCLKHTLKHKKAIFYLWFKYDTGVSFFRMIMHDTIKLFLIAIFGDKLASILHSTYARHHNISNQSDFAEAYLDWASARLTKEDKPLDAIETAQKYYPVYYQRALNWFEIVKFK